MKFGKIELIGLNLVFICLVITFLVYLGNNSTAVIVTKDITDTLSEDKIQLLDKIDTDLLVSTNQYKRGENSYEEAIINNDEFIPYKLIKMEVDNYKTFLLVTYDPSNVRLMVSPGFNTGNNSGLEKIINMTKRYGAVAGINGGGFFDNGLISSDLPMGIIIKDGKILWGDENKVGNLIGFSKDNKLTLVSKTSRQAIKDGMRDAVEFGPFLMVDGKITKEAEAMKERRASRVIIAQREDGIVLFLVTEGSSFSGPKMGNLVNILKNYGAYNMANLDGGASSQLVIDGVLYNDPRTTIGTKVTNGRGVINGWGVFAS